MSDYPNIYMDGNVVIDTGWRCVICYEVAQCWCVDVCLCVKHAKEYDFGYGKSIAQMKKELNETT